MAAGDTRNATDALYSLADAISEQRLLLRDIRDNTRALLELWRSSSAEGAGAPVAADVDEPSPDQGEQAKQQQPNESSSDRMVRLLITQQLGIDPRELSNMSEEEMLVKLATLNKGQQNGAGGAPPGNTTT